MIREHLGMADVIGIDWATDMSDARELLGSEVVLQGNLDPAVLFAEEKIIREAVNECCRKAAGRHILNLGHGVIKVRLTFGTSGSPSDSR